MFDEEKGFEIVESGLEFIRGGTGCICSPGGYESGRDSGCGCACGCFTDVGTVDNTCANRKKAGNCPPCK